VTPDQRNAVLSLVAVPNAGPPADPDEVLRRFDTSDGHELGVRLLRDAVQRKDADGVSMALIVTAVYGVSTEHLQPLLALATAPWHRGHEDVVTELRRLRSPTSVDALRHLAQWVPGYLDYDENRALAVKAVRALGSIPGEAADRALLSLLDSDSEIVRLQTTKQIERRRSA